MFWYVSFKCKIIINSFGLINNQYVKELLPFYSPPSKWPWFEIYSAHSVLILNWQQICMHGFNAYLKCLSVMILGLWLVTFELKIASYALDLSFSTLNTLHYIINNHFLTKSLLRIHIWKYTLNTWISFSFSESLKASFVRCFQTKSTANLFVPILSEL